MAFKPNRDLLNANFEGYKLSSSSLNCGSRALEGAVHEARLKDGDFSYQHMRAFSLHNHLTVDIYDDSCVYWCTEDGSIQRATYLVSCASVASAIDCKVKESSYGSTL